MPEPTMGEMARWTFYQRYIAERTKDIDPRHVEAWMRLEHPTLDGLSRQEFTEAMYAALASATGVAWVIVQLSGATNLLPVLIEIELDAINYQDANAAGLTAIGTLTTSERNAAADALLDRANSIETGKTLRQALKIIAAILAGKVSGAGTNTEIFRAIDDSAARATVTADASGNRSEIAYNV